MKESLTESEKAEKEYSKWKSRRWLICAWSMFLVTAIVVLGIVYKNDSYVPIATTLVAIPISFVSLETVKKWKQNEG